MTVPVHDVAAAFRARLPGLPVKKLHKLLYMAQGHHLASLGAPLFTETISAWDMGPVVGSLWSMERKGVEPKSHGELGEAELNTIGYVVHRYGALSGNDLEALTHAQDPWRLADAHRRPRETARIEVEWIRRWFSDSEGDEEDLALDSEQVSAWLAGAEDRLADELSEDNLDELRARLVAERG